LKKAPLLITLAIVVLTIGGYYAYELYYKQRVKQAWELIPKDAIAVYEKNDCAACIEEVGSSVPWRLFWTASHFQQSQDSIATAIFDSFKKLKGVVVSLHITKKDDFDFLFYFPLPKNTAQLNLPYEGKSRKRMLNGVEIFEISIAGQLFSFTVIDQVWVGSYTPFLLEDVIRNHTKGSDASHTRLRASAFNSIKDDAGNLYIRLDQFSDLLSVFLRDHSIRNLIPGKSAMLDVKSAKGELVLNGFSTDSVDHSRYLLSIFHHQSPVSFGLKNLVPNRSVAVTSYGISDGESFFTDLRKHNHQPSRSQFDSLVATTGSVVNYPELFRSLSDEIAICYLESRRSAATTKIVLIESASVNKWLEAFGKLSSRFSIDTVFTETYGGYTIGEVPIYSFVPKLFSPLVTGISHTYYTNIGNVIVISDQLEELKLYLSDIEAEDTWGKSVSRNRFLETTLLESNLSIYINTTRAWNMLSRDMHPRWQSFLKDHRALLQGIQMTSIQFSHLNNSYYTNALITYKDVDEKSTAVQNSQRTITQFERPLINMYAVRSHVNRSNEVLVQDSANDLSLVSSDGKVLWKLSIGGPIISDVTQVDFFNNGKLQYFFSTKDAIHIVDRLGNYVTPYPLHFENVDIQYVRVIDYDNSKKYRFLVADIEGKVRMFDKDGQPLLGWEPNDAGGALAMPPQHYRILGKDYIIAVRKDGVINLWNRRGERLKNFPLATNSLPAGDLFLERENTLNETAFVMISADGYRIRFNPQGKILNRETLPKTSVLSNFGLLNEKSAKCYVIVQQDDKQLQLVSDDQQVKVSYPMTSITPSDVNYYNFGGGKSYISIRDKVQGVCYVFDLQGNLITTPPLEGSSIELRPLSNDQFVVFFIHQNALVIQAL
jgi:hypothetical protein